MAIDPAGVIDLLEVGEAQARILAAMSALPTETVPLQAALGRVLAADIVAARDQPPAAVSAMDGYAVRAADTAAESWLEVVGEAAAGQPLAFSVGPGKAARIFTGGLLPDGADAILIQEDAVAEGGRVLAKEAVSPGLFVRERGLDYKAGWTGLRAGQRLDPRHIGLAASLGAGWVEVRRKPRIGILATGNELVLPGRVPEPHQISSSNSFTLAAMIESWGGQAVDLGIALDEPAALAARLDAAQGLDLLVTSGGASVGEHDLVQSVAGERGLELDFWKIRMRPGKPLIFGRIGLVPLLGLPGNPVSAAVCGIVFLRGAIRRLLGRDPMLPSGMARLAEPLGRGGERQEYLRAERDEEGAVRATGRQDSSMFAALATADVLLVRPPREGPLERGATVTVIDLATVLRD